MANKFPKTLYIKVENEGEEDERLNTATDIEELAEIGQTVKIAEYQLVKVAPVHVKINWDSLKEK